MEFTCQVTTIRMPFGSAIKFIRCRFTCARQLAFLGFPSVMRFASHCNAPPSFMLAHPFLHLLYALLVPHISYSRLHKMSCFYFCGLALHLSAAQTLSAASVLVPSTSGITKGSFGDSHHVHSTLVPRALSARPQVRPLAHLRLEPSVLCVTFFLTRRLIFTRHILEPCIFAPFPC